jgi:MFS family permease
MAVCPAPRLRVSTVVLGGLGVRHWRCATVRRVSRTVEASEDAGDGGAVIDGALGGVVDGRRAAFYGWYVVAAAAAIAFVAWGVAFWNIGVFLYAFHEERGWSRSALSGSATLFNIVAGLTGLTAGRVVDRHGPRAVLIFGGLTTGLGMLGLGQVRELWQVYACYAVLALGYGCIHVLVLGALIARWFRRRRALAMTLALTGSSVGGLVLVPLSTTLIARFDIATAATTLALVAWGLVLPAAIFVVRNRPESLGLQADGDRTVIEDGPALTAGETWTLGAALRTIVWWAITLAFTLTLMGQSSYLIHQVSFLSPRLGLAGAGLAVAITTSAGVVGRFGMGWVGDRFSKRYLAVGCYLLQASSVLCAISSDSPLVLYATAGAIGLTIGIVIAMHPLMVVEGFGVSSFGTVYGPAYLSTQLGQAFGPLLVGTLADLTGEYTVPFAVTASAAVVAACLLWCTPDRPS